MLAQAKGHYSVRHKHYRKARESVMHALRYATQHRREKKGDMRRLWLIRINAAARMNGISYSKLIHGLSLAGVDVNRKVLSDLAVRDPQTFSIIAEQAKSQLVAETPAA